MAKRSPILGYNHNVRYRGLVFHVQTEDSGLLSPHLFTHLFHGGVIISTRKLVYDAGAAEDAIKSLMQAQHKAALKELKKGSFDDKIDQYLGGTPGLLPRGEGGVDNDDSQMRPSMAQMPSDGAVMIDTQPLPLSSVPPPEPATSRQATVAEIAAPTRTKTAERGSGPGALRANMPPPPSDDFDGPTFNRNDAANMAAAVAAANLLGPPRFEPGDVTVPNEMPQELSPLEIELELDEPDELPPRRTTRDTAIEPPMDPIMLDTPKRPPSESMPIPSVPAIQPRASSVGAAALPPRLPSKMPSRPAITPPQVVSRPLTSTGDQRRGDDAVEVYAPAPPGAEPPPGERPGQYSQHKRGVSQKVPVIETFKDRTASGAVPVPPGLGRPGRISSQPAQPSSGVPRAPTQGGAGSKGNSTRDSGAAAIVQPVPREQSSGIVKPRTTTPQRLTPPPPASSRTASASSGVVMTRPAVIVGAPAKPNQPARVRKAREDEGRGFGQGLISEKSLDEVILAYLSEDADEK